MKLSYLFSAAFIADTLCAMEPPVILISSLKSSYLCPEDYNVVTFSCVTTSPYVYWTIDTRHLVFESSQVGLTRRVNGYRATLLHCDEEPRKCISILNIVSGEYESMDVQCSNGTVSTSVGISYQRILGPPLQPSLIRKEKMDENKLLLSWTPGRNLSHYVLQLDDATPIIVKNSSIVLYTDTSPDIVHTVHLYAVDECAQRSEVFIEEFSMDGDPSTLVLSSDTTQSSQSTITSQPLVKDSVPVTAFVATVVCLFLLMFGMIIVGIMFIGCKFKVRQYHVKKSQELDCMNHSKPYTVKKPPLSEHSSDASSRSCSENIVASSEA